MSGYYIDSNHLLQGPGVIHKLLPEAATQEKIAPWSLILHSQAGPRLTPWESLWKYMARTDISGEAHLLANLDGTIIQLIPFNVVAHCNAKANVFNAFGGRAGALSIETQDNGYPTLETTPWLLPQFNALVGATAAVGHKYGIPYSPPTAWNDRGVGYHSQYAEWSIYKGKTCPGAARIRQMDELRRQAANTCACG